jgi:hypothetical protein
MIRHHSTSLDFFHTPIDQNHTKNDIFRTFLVGQRCRAASYTARFDSFGQAWTTGPCRRGERGGRPIRALFEVPSLRFEVKMRDIAATTARPFPYPCPPISKSKASSGHGRDSRPGIPPKPTPSVAYYNGLSRKWTSGKIRESRLRLSFCATFASWRVYLQPQICDYVGLTPPTFAQTGTEWGGFAAPLQVHKEL